MTIRDAIRAKIAAIRQKAQDEVNELEAHLQSGEGWLEKEVEHFEGLLAKLGLQDK